MSKILRWIIFLCCLGRVAGAFADTVDRKGLMVVQDQVNMSVQAVATATPVQALWQAVWQSHPSEVALTALVLCALGLSLAMYLWRNKRLLRDLTRINREAQASLQIADAAFNSEVGMVVTDSATRIQRVNVAMASLLGCTPDELAGQTTQILRGGLVTKGTLHAVWQKVRAQGRWQGELLCRHRDGHDVPCIVTIAALRDPNNAVTGYVGSFSDISRQKKAQDDIQQLAYYDPLTELPNRRMFLEALRMAMRTALQNGTLAGIMFMDLDHFKNLNDAHGHTVGDQLLKLMSQRLHMLMGPDDMAARLGGDEFVVMMPRLDTGEERAMAQTMAMAERIHHALLAPFELDTPSRYGVHAQSLRYVCSGSIGVALFGLIDEPLTEVLKRADVAMYQSKQDGRNRIRRFDPIAQKVRNERIALSDELNLAQRDDQLQLLFQLQTDAHNLAVGAECLLRWKHPWRGTVSPVEFIPLAEASGVIVSIGDWVLRSACNTLARWASDPGLSHLTLSVNVSPRQFTESDFVTRVSDILTETGARPQLLRLEVTEGIVMQDAQEVIEKMRELCALGLSFSIDDFGTGYSSLSYMQMLPLAELKIDKAFVNDLTTSERSEAIVKAIIALGQSMNIVIVSEGVETQAQKDRLLALGCTLLQGFLIARPMACCDLEKLVAAHHSAPVLALS